MADPDGNVPFSDSPLAKPAEVSVMIAAPMPEKAERTVEAVIPEQPSGSPSAQCSEKPAESVPEKLPEKPVVNVHEKLLGKAEEKPPEKPPEPAVVAAKFKDSPVTEPWCPVAIQPHLGFQMDYEDHGQLGVLMSSGWNLIAATRRGRLHAHYGTHREDAFGYYADPSFSIVCVSDGAGSSKHSRIGSEKTCRTVIAYLTEFLQKNRSELQALSSTEVRERLAAAVGESVGATCRALEELAAKTESLPKDYRCTLLLGILLLWGDTPQLAFSQVGDGFMAAQLADGSVQRHGQADSGDFAGEVKCFIPDAEAVHNAKQVIWLDVATADAFIFCSDGIEDPFFPLARKAKDIFRQLRDGVTEALPDFQKQVPHGPILGSPDAAARLATWLQFEKKGENDDRTVVVLHRLPSTLKEAN